MGRISEVLELLESVAVLPPASKELAMYRKSISVAGCTAAFCLAFTLTARAADLDAPYFEKSPGYATAWSLPSDMGEAGYYGGSSGGIPGTGVPAYERNYDEFAPGIPPQDRPYPSWNGPGRLLR
jgi:hypothetical protein